MLGLVDVEFDRVRGRHVSYTGFKHSTAHSPQRCRQPLGCADPDAADGRCANFMPQRHRQSDRRSDIVYAFNHGIRHRPAHTVSASHPHPHPSLNCHLAALSSIACPHGAADASRGAAF